MLSDRYVRRSAVRSAIGLVGILLLAVGAVRSQSLDRVTHNGEPIFLNGGNVAWVEFARDIGPGRPALGTFEQIFRSVREHKGNAVRIWLHTNGRHTPAWRDSTVVGPGATALDDLRAILNVAREQGVGVILCLWSFDMLRKKYPSRVTDRAYHLLTDPSLTRSYLENALIPMVRAVKDHPSVIAWEIFNEPEGMSHKYGWDFTRHVPMSDIQRVVNRAAGAIHRTDPDAKVTTGAWTFKSLSDESPKKRPEGQSEPPGTQVRALKQTLSRRSGRAVTTAEARAAYKRWAASEWHHYYTDERLVAAGGDPKGTLDFYSVHHYDWAEPMLSPFRTDRSYWSTSKPVVVSEFAATDYGTLALGELSITLFRRGYAGGLAWQWYDRDEAWERALTNMERVGRMTSGAVDVPPMRTRLVQNIPNPFRTQTTIWYDLKERAAVTLTVYDQMGREVATLVDAVKSAGRHTVSFRGADLAAGVYFYRLETGDFSKTRPMGVVR